MPVWLLEEMRGYRGALRAYLLVLDNERVAEWTYLGAGDADDGDGL